MVRETVPAWETENDGDAAGTKCSSQKKGLFFALESQNYDDILGKYNVLLQWRSNQVEFDANLSKV